jgi:hypothetical protein
MLGLPLFHQQSSLPPLFGIASFSLEVFCFEPLAFWGYLSFHRRSFVLSPLHFGVDCFFIGGFFE